MFQLHRALSAAYRVWWFRLWGLRVIDCPRSPGAPVSPEPDDPDLPIPLYIPDII